MSLACMLFLLFFCVRSAAIVNAGQHDLSRKSAFADFCPPEFFDFARATRSFRARARHPRKFQCWDPHPLSSSVNRFPGRVCKGAHLRAKRALSRDTQVTRLSRMSSKNLLSSDTQVGILSLFRCSFRKSSQHPTDGQV